MINHEDEYSRSHEREFDHEYGCGFELKKLDIPAALGLITLLAICVFGLLRFLP